MKAAIATTRTAGPEAFRDLRAQLDPRIDWVPQAALLFATGESAPLIPQIIDDARRFASGCLIGGSAGWILSSEDPGSGRGALGMMVLSEARSHFEGRMVSALDQLIGWPDEAPVIAVADPRADLAVLEQIMRRDPIAGGGIAGFEGDRFLACNRELGEGGCALLRLPAHHLLVGTASGLTPSGPTFTVTKTRGRRLLALDGAPPLHKMLKHFQSIGDLDQEETITAGLFLCDLGAGDRTTGRMILSIDRMTGALDLDQEVLRGSTVAFATRDTVGGQRAMTQMLEGLATRLQGRTPVAGVLLSSFERSDLFLDRDFEVQEIARAFPGLPVLGMSTTFEMVHSSLQFHSAVFALLLDT